jgi:hypothetical protein
VIDDGPVPQHGFCALLVCVALALLNAAPTAPLSSL